MTGLDGKAALVTGGSRGIGRAIAERLAGDGAEVVLSYAANEDAAAEVVAVITAAGGKAHAVAADLREPGAARRLFEQAEAIVGPLDILVNNAAVGITAGRRAHCEHLDSEHRAQRAGHGRLCGQQGGT